MNEYVVCRPPLFGNVIKLVELPENWYEPPALPSGPGARLTSFDRPGGLDLRLMSAVSYCPFRGKKATGRKGTVIKKKSGN